MLRVARVGVVMIEPVDQSRPLDLLKSAIKRVLRGNVSQQFEPSGNYIYRPSVRELRKLMLAMGGQSLASCGINDFYDARLVHHDFKPGHWPTMATQLGIGLQNVLCKTRLLGYGLACIVVFKGAVPGPLRTAMRAVGFQIDDLPKKLGPIHTP